MIEKILQRMRISSVYSVFGLVHQYREKKPRLQSQTDSKISIISGFVKMLERIPMLQIMDHQARVQAILSVASERNTQLHSLYMR